MNFEVDLELSADLWARTLEQVLLVILIIGRWLLPKGSLTRDQLSQLLLVYIGMAADIVELFESFKEDQVVKNVELTYVILGIWTWSLLQFTMVLTATKARKTRAGADGSINDDVKNDGGKRQGCCDIDICAIFSSLLLQDGPFLCLRLLLIFRYHIFSYMNIFFTCKNSLLVLLQLYRLFVVVARKMTRQKNKCYDHGLNNYDPINFPVKEESNIGRMSNFSSSQKSCSTVVQRSQELATDSSSSLERKIDGRESNARQLKSASDRQMHSSCGDLLSENKPEMKNAKRRCKSDVNPPKQELLIRPKRTSDNLQRLHIVNELTES
ncbi:Uncharacterised protein g9490 [Pycnogonum litorale]